LALINENSALLTGSKLTDINWNINVPSNYLSYLIRKQYAQKAS